MRRRRKLGAPPGGHVHTITHPARCLQPEAALLVLVFVPLTGAVSQMAAELLSIG